MNRFALARPGDLEQTRELRKTAPDSLLKAGGIDVLDHLKQRLLEPSQLVDLKGVSGLKGVGIEAAADGSLRIGPLVTLARVAADANVVRTHPALARACAEAASPQIRNMATLGGNLLQRPRCWYYRLEDYGCLKKGGDVCYAITGENRYHVIFGGGPSYAVHPSNAAVVLLAYGGSLVLEGAKGRRTVAADNFFVLPDPDPLRENVLQPDEVLVEVLIPSAQGHRSAYQEVRERAAFDWPLVSAAVSLVLKEGRVTQARIVLGAVAPIPWRVERAERALIGRTLDEAVATEAAQEAVAGALPLSDNGYKVALVQTLLRRTLLSLA